MTDTPQEPLWRVMYQAYDTSSHPQWEEHHGMAAEIRAVADWLVPEEPEPPAGDGEPWPQAYQQRSDAMWEQRQTLRQRLLAEADRAERGDA